MNTPGCSLWFFVARTDVSFMVQTISHLVKMNSFPFEERVLAIDTAPLSGEKKNRPGLGTLEQLRSRARYLLDNGTIDRVVEIDYSPSYRERVYKKHFGKVPRATHNYKGYPVLGSIFKIEECRSEYMVHYDSDMMLHQEPGHDWVTAGIEMMEKHDDLMFVRPLSGPPGEDGKIHLDKHIIDKHPDGFYRYRHFGSRVYLLNCRRYEKLLPLPLLWRPYKNPYLDYLPDGLKTKLNTIAGKGYLDSWEVMVSAGLQKSEYYRATLTDPKAWTLHPVDRSERFREKWPNILKKVEEGYYPPQQAGYYDMISPLWV